VKANRPSPKQLGTIFYRKSEAVMTRSVIILLLIIAISLVAFKIFDKNAGAQDEGGISQVLENQKLILEKLDSIDHKVDVLKTRIR
jgi:peptidoglycan hydrolase CwlO-like protein